MQRISCANHKTNLAVKSAMNSHGTITKQVKKLNSFISSIRKSVEQTKHFAFDKCRLRLENITRWGSTFLMFEKLQKAHKKGLLENLKLPVSMNVINNYLIILKHPYLLNISLQRNTCTISEVIPSLLKVLHHLQVISEQTTHSGKDLCRLLIEQFKKRFEFELNSDIYKVITLYFDLNNHI